MLVAYAEAAETRGPPTVPTGRASTCCSSLPGCEKSVLTTRKEYAIAGFQWDVIQNRFKKNQIKSKPFNR